MKYTKAILVFRIWKGNPDLSKLNGKAEKLQFVMKDPDLYNMIFE